MQQRTPNSAPHVLLQRRYNFGPFEPHLYLQCTAPHPPQAQPDPPQGQTEVVSVIPNTDPHSPKGSALRPRLIGPANQFFSKQGKGWEKNIVYKIHLITYIFYCDRKRTCNSAGEVQEMGQRTCKTSFRDERGSPSLHHQEPLYAKTMFSVFW